VRRPGRPAERRPGGGFSSAAWPSGPPCGSASWCGQVDDPCGRTFPVSPLCRSSKSLHRRPGRGLR
jgi:hypothetical protein